MMLAVHGHGADLSGINFGSPEDWVHPQMFSRQPSPNTSDATANDHLLLLEHQINAPENEEFFHSERRILTTDGVQNDSTLKINFDPSYESLTWHWARIWRDGQPVDRLDTNSVQIVRREQDLDEAMLNGEKTAVLILNDVRVGDVIDYAYSLKGENPISSGHFSAIVPVQIVEPADRLLTRMIWPREKGLYSIGHGCSVQPVTRADKDTLEVNWDFQNVPAAPVEDALPVWFDPNHWVQVSDFRTWAEVNQWALKLFQSASASPFSSELTAKIVEWKRIPNQEQQILAALRFVQDEVRYVGIEIGEGSEKPTSPSTVFSRRFGDCKDKSLLFVTILRALGIQAFPVLVNATLGRTIENWQPCASAFDHCIAQVQLYGQTWYLDSTMNYQRGPLAAHYLPNYGYGLVISPWTTRLTQIPQTTGLPKTTTTEYFKLGMVNQPATLKVVTVAEGRDAEILRATFATTTVAEIEKASIRNYSDVYSGIKMSSPIVFEDDEDQNRFRITESYSMAKMWTRPEKGVHKVECEFYPAGMAGLLKKPVDTDRTLPMGIGFPEHQILRTEVTLATSWTADNEQKTVTDPAFTFRKHYWSGGNKVLMEYEYQTSADSVAADAFGDYLQRIDECSKMLGNTLAWETVTVPYQ
ncbi:MAG TPA: DUF3857 domain-containing transglutaminase family protein [Verrucomicrobiae bacterium]|jgi:hypothetical protein|nr:DUF3857 domain-containing transglutaminase family protein [Verrucomicrobiae bacterium]